MPAPMRPRSTIITVLTLAAATPAQTLEEVRDSVRDAARSTRYPLFVASFLGLTDEAELSGGRFRIDGDPVIDLSVLTLPLHREFDLGEHAPRLLAEANFGYATADLELADIWNGISPALATHVDADFQALAGFAGLGPVLALGDGFELAPLAVGGVAHVQSDARYDGPGAAFTSAVLDGILFNWDATYAIYGGSVLLRHGGWQWGSVKVEPRLRYDLRRMSPIVVDDPVQDEVSTVQWLVARVGFEGPTGWQIGDHDVDWQADIAGKAFDHHAAEALGFGNLFEVGAGLRWNCGDGLPGVSEVRFSGAVFVGDDISGWTIGASVGF